MPRLADPRPGTPLEIRGRALKFSYWPMYRTTRRYGLQSHVYVTNPWAVIRSAVNGRCATAPLRLEAGAYTDQARFLFDAATGTKEWAAKPLLLYYSFMNLAKAFILVSGLRSMLDQAQHGCSEKLRVGRRELLDAYLEVYPSPPSGRASVFADFWRSLSGYTLSTKVELDLTALLPQVVAGHRVWCDAAHEQERFIGVKEIQILHNKPTKELWAVLHVFGSTLPLLGLSSRQMLLRSGLSPTFREVKGVQDAATNQWILRFEQRATTVYTHRPSDQVQELIQGFRHSLSATATTISPYRTYYIYVAPPGGRTQVLPQLLAIYAISFYLGSITRYRPQHFDSILGSSFGGHLQEFLASQPMQFLYLLASEFARREITRAELV